MGSASGLTDNDALMRIVLKEAHCKIGEEEERRREIERAVMESAYMKDLQQTQAHRRVEEERRKADLEAIARREKEEEDQLAVGIEMYKVGSYGDAKLTTVTLEKQGASEWLVRWSSKRKKDEEACMKISQCSLHFGLRHGNFATRRDFQKRFTTAKKMAFTLKDHKRTLDLVAQTSHDINAWKALFYRTGFPLQNAAAVLRVRRRIEKKKTIKRMAAAAKGKLNVRIESSDEDYDYSGGEGTETPENEPAAAAAAGSNGFSSSSAAAASASAASSEKKIGRRRASSRVPSDDESHQAAEDEEKKEKDKVKKATRRRGEEDY